MARDPAGGKLVQSTTTIRSLNPQERIVTSSPQLARATVLPLLLLLAAACSDSTEPPRPESLQAASPTNQQAPAGATVPEPPAVIVRDQNGSPMPGVAVDFAVTGGAGTISPASVTTDANGVARLASWTLGQVPGNNVVTATVGTSKVTFSAEGIRVPANVDFVSPPQMQVVAGSTVQGHPAVLVRDQTGAPLAGVTVTFQVTSGSSTITPTTIVTGAEGTADWGVARATSWHIPAQGAHTVTATVAGLPPATFTATGLDPAVCDPVGSVTVPGAVTGALSPGDCPLPTGEFVDHYLLEVATRSIVRIRAVSNAVDMYLLLSTTAGRPVAENDDDGLSLNSDLVAVLEPGSYHVGVTSFAPGETGAYNLTTEIVAEGAPRACLPLWFVTHGATVSGSLAPSECAFLGRHIDLYVIFLAAGETARITMISPELDAYLVFVDASGNLIENDNLAAGTFDARITFTAPLAGFYLFGTTSAQPAIGAYTLTID